MAIDWTPEMLATLRDLRERGAPYAICASALDISYASVMAKCVKLGLDNKDRSNWRAWRSWRAIHHPRKE